MAKNEDENGIEGLLLPEPTSAELRGRQSVRATFRLSERAIDALSIVSVHLGIKQKSLFDHLNSVIFNSSFIFNDFDLMIPVMIFSFVFYGIYVNNEMSCVNKEILKNIALLKMLPMLK